MSSKRCTHLRQGTSCYTLAKVALHRWMKVFASYGTLTVARCCPERCVASELHYKIGSSIVCYCLSLLSISGGKFKNTEFL